MFDFYFLLEGILLRVVVYVPAQCHPEFINEVAARFLFLIGGGKIEAPLARKSATNCLTRQSLSKGVMNRDVSKKLASGNKRGNYNRDEIK